MGSGVHALVVTGVAGAGKSTVGRALAERLGWAFFDADDYHPIENIGRMRAGLPLTDADRLPWLRILAERIGRWVAEGTGVVLACSALKRDYRAILARGQPGVRFVHLAVGPDVLRERMRAREGHFMPESLLTDQLETLEVPKADENAWVIPAEGTVDETVEAILARLAKVTDLPG